MSEDTEPRYDGTSLRPCSANDCIMLSPAERQGRVGTNGGCAHLKQRGPDANQLIRKLAREVVRLRIEVALERDLVCHLERIAECPDEAQ